MLDNARLEQVLIRLARKYAAPLAASGWQQPGDYEGRLPDLATALAEYNMLVLAGAPAAAGAIDAEDYITGWVQGYVRLYDMLCKALFPSYTEVQAYYVDNLQPPIVVLQGEAAPVLMMLAGYIAPFVVSRQGTNVSDFELRGLVDLVLDNLEAHDLERKALDALRDDAIAGVQQLLASPVRQLHVTAPVLALARNFDVGATPVDPLPAPEGKGNPADVPAPGEASAPPDMLPEEETLGLDESRPFAASIPIFYEPRPRPKRRPPVPDLPEDLK